MATNPLDRLPQVLQARRKEIAGLVNRVVRESARQGGAELAADTAVDTGTARSNWVATIDIPFESVIPAYSPYAKLGNAAATAARKEEVANLSAVEAQHDAATAAFDMERNTSVIIRNNVEYIGMIGEEGHSPQTAPGLLQRGLEVAKSAITGTWKLRA